uniref:Rho-GAP domain-containing protein n=1 Tax=Periophthalmus magnuspinnatus TaxID=409849 RepID=A0A3B4AAY1_9GOBI
MPSLCVSDALPVCVRCPPCVCQMPSLCGLVDLFETWRRCRLTLVFSSLSRRTDQYMVHSFLICVSGPQDSLDELEMDDYWKEVENISRSTDGDRKGEEDSQEEEPSKTPEEGEQEEAWLVEAGLARLFDDSAPNDQEQDSAAFLSTLTRSQAAAIERRVQQTLRRRNRQHLPDVRDIFRPPGHHKHMVKCVSAATPSGGTDAYTVYVCELTCFYLFQNFKLLRDKTGQTRIGDLSPQDMKKVNRLVLVEMTALFDTAGVDIKAQKPVKIKTKDSGLFGVSLNTLLEQDQKRIPGTKVPIILQRLISHIEDEGLDTEGLLRIPGAATRVKALCQDLESSFYDGRFSWGQLKQHDAASLLKLLIRELPLPLLSAEHLNAFIAVNSYERLVARPFLKGLGQAQPEGAMWSRPPVDPPPLGRSMKGRCMENGSGDMVCHLAEGEEFCSLFFCHCVKKELSPKAKFSIYLSLTSPHELWVMTKRTRSWIQAAEMGFRCALS